MLIPDETFSGSYAERFLLGFASISKEWRECRECFLLYTPNFPSVAECTRDTPEVLRILADILSALGECPRVPLSVPTLHFLSQLSPSGAHP